MSDFMQETPAALKWAEEAEQRHQAGKFGEIVRAVVWTDERGPDGQLLVAVDPDRLVAQINSNPFTLLDNHWRKGDTQKKLITRQQKAASSPANYFADIEVRLRYPAPGFELAE